MPRAHATARLLARLHSIRADYRAESTAEKLGILAEVAGRPVRSPQALSGLHDDLLFLRAFPDDPRVASLARASLDDFAARVQGLSARARASLDDSGMCATTSRYVFPFGIVVWLVGLGEHAEIDWQRLESPDTIDALLRPSLTQLEADALDAGALDVRAWLRLARSADAASDLAWIVSDRLGRSSRRPSSRSPSLRALFEQGQVPVAWTLDGRMATTHNCHAGVVTTPRRAMRRTPSDARTLIASPMRVVGGEAEPGTSRTRGAIVRLPPALAREWIHVARAALAARCREVHAINYASDLEVYHADLGEGTAVCVFGVDVAERFALEANYGHVLFANGVPVGYGGVSPLAAQANTGVNIFDAFRHSEAAYLFAQALRAFRALFRVTRFVVNPYQFGADNDEALSSGAFWFYDRLGFRSADREARALAASERGRIAADRTYRSSPRVLRRLASCDVILELPGSRTTRLFEERWLTTMAVEAAGLLAAPSATARAARLDGLLDAVALAVQLPARRAMPRDERLGFERLAPVVALVLDDVVRWPAADRRALAAMLRAKGAQQQRTFSLLSRGRRRFWRALAQRCASVESRVTSLRPGS